MYRWDMMITIFDIFCGRVDNDAVWVETVEGFGNAYELMTKIAEGIPGCYFIVSQKDAYNSWFNRHLDQTAAF
jgi:hypothetical protein